MRPESGASAGGGIALRLFLATALASVTVALVATGVHVYFQYRAEVGELRATLALIERVHVPAIAGNLFAVNDEQIALQLQGLLNFPGIVYAEVREEKENYRYQKTVGVPLDSGGLQRTYDLFHSFGAEERLHLGDLTVHAGYEALHDRFRSSAIFIALTTFSQIFITAVLIFILAQRSVTRRLVRLADYANRLTPPNLEEAPRLTRRGGPRRKPDEIDRVAEALNELRLRVREDIRKREWMNRRLRESEARFRSLTDNLPVGVFRVSADERILFVNPEMARMFGFDSVRQMIGRNPAEFYVHAEDREPVLNLRGDGIRLNATEIPFRRTDGTVFHGSLQAIRFQDEDGTVVAIDGTLADITERRKAEEAADRRTRELETLYRLGQESAEGLSLKGTLHSAIGRLQALLPAEMILVFLREGDRLRVRAHSRMPAPHVWAPARSHRVGECLCGLAAEKGKPVYSSDIHADDRCVLPECKAAGLRSFAAFPLENRNELIGVLAVGAMKETDFRAHSAFLETAARTLAIGIHNIQLYRSLEENAEQLNGRLSELERSRKALRESEYRFRSFFKSNPEGVLLLDFDGRILDANGAARSITGFEKTALCKLRLHDLARGGSRKAVVDALAGIQGGDLERTPMEIRLRRADETDLPAAIRTWRVRDEAGNPLALGVFLRDLSAEKALAEQKANLERQLQHTQKMEAIGTLAGGIAHDFNNILGGIIGFAELAVEHESRDPSRIPHFHRRMLEACKRAKELVEQILKFGRREPAELQPCALAPLVKETLHFLRSSLPSTIEIHGVVEAEAEWVFGDPTQLHQVIVNLCTNAYHAMRPGPGRLTVALKNAHFDGVRRFHGLEIPPGEYAMLEVGDTGRGVPAHCRDRIFDPYFTTKDVDEGSGLGLSVSFAIVKNHKGLIEFDSREGAGATFRVFLPLSEHEAEAPRKPEDPLPMGRGERVLLVDDELFFLDVLREHLETLAYDPVSFQSSDRALQSFRAQPTYFDLVITDQTMPDLTGVQLIGEIRKIRTDIPIILCTGFSETVTEESAGRRAISRFLMKPVHRATLAEAVDDLLAERRDHGTGFDHR
jgi:PAS domain S-box-containing protein